MVTEVVSLLLIAGLCGLGTSAPAPAIDTTSLTGQMAYFSMFGYMGEKSPDPRIQEMTDAEQYNQAIRSFQEFNNLPVTGIMDAATSELMAKPRCGMPDMVNEGDIMKRRKKRFALEGSRWTTTNNVITYYISNYSPDLPRAKQDEELAKGFKVWEDVSSLKFERRYSRPADIEILFGPGEHGDGIPFDGPGMTLAHAFFPQYGGDAHFDEDENWTADTSQGINLFQVAAHEFGHSLGLSHSSVNTALMAPYYQGYQPNFKLDDDDVMGIQQLYGRPSVTTQRPPATTSTTRRPTMDPDNMPDFCIDSSFDAVTRVADGKTYAFKGDQVYELVSGGGIARGYPKRISERFSGVPSNLDAALYMTAKVEYYYSLEVVNGRYRWVRNERVVQEAATWFFKGSYCYKYDHQSETTQRFNMADKFTGVPTPLTAAFVWSGNNKVYFVKGAEYYRWESTNYVPNSYPRSTKGAWGVDTIDAALQWSNGRTYLFSGNDYYRYNDQTYAIDNANPAYPRKTAEWWLGCAPSELTNMDMEMEQEDHSGMIEVPGMMNNGTDVTGSGVTVHAPSIMALLVLATLTLRLL